MNGWACVAAIIEMTIKPLHATPLVFSRNDPFLLDLLHKFIRLAPKGKGALPRLFGKLFFRYFNQSCLTTRHGAKLKIAPLALDFYTTMLEQNRSFDYWVFDTCRSFINVKSVFYDIGANVGYMSVEMAQCVDSKVNIYSFEAQQDLALNVVQSADLNNFSNIKVFACALAEQNGEVEFVKEKHSIHGHLNKSDDSTIKTVKIDAYTIDFLIAESIIDPPDVIKIDVEGAEHKVLSGMSETIKKFQPVIVFEISKDTYDFDTTPKQIVDYLSGLANYKFYWANGSYREEVEVTESDLEKRYSENNNIVACLS